MSRTSDAAFEQRLMAEISMIDWRIAQLSAEKEALTRQLLKAREQRSNLKDVTRINSGQRVIVEQKILDFLSQTGGRKSPAEILAHVRRTAVHDLKGTTLRTYLWRMRERGLVTSPEWGAWSTAQNQEKK